MTVPHEVDESTLTYSYVSYVLDKGEWTKLVSPDKTRQSVYGRSMNASGVVVASIDSIDEDTKPSARSGRTAKGAFSTRK